MPVPPQRWGDDRLDDLAATVRVLSVMPQQVEVLRQELKNTNEDQIDLRTELIAVEKRLNRKIDAVENSLNGQIGKVQSGVMTAIIAFAAPITLLILGAVIKVLFA